MMVIHIGHGVSCSQLVLASVQLWKNPQGENYAWYERVGTDYAFVQFESEKVPHYLH
jgi:nitrate reductase beta subunit